MNFNEYQKLANTTANKENTTKEALVNVGLGLTGEAGEVADLIKKNLCHGHDLDKEKLHKELGDVLWYLAYAAETLGTSLEEIAKMNIDKLKKRYPEGFSTDASVNRVQ